MSGQVTALVVETNYLVASAIEFPLNDAGYATAVATTYPEALALLDTHHIDIAIIDFRMQHADPDGLVARLMGAGIPFIFCTAASTEEVVEHFRGARVLNKPFEDADLVSRVMSAIAGGSSVSVQNP